MNPLHRRPPTPYPSPPPIDHQQPVVMDNNSQSSNPLPSTRSLSRFFTKLFALPVKPVLPDSPTTSNATAYGTIQQTKNTNNVGAAAPSPFETPQISPFLFRVPLPRMAGGSGGDPGVTSTDKAGEKKTDGTEGEGLGLDVKPPAPGPNLQVPPQASGTRSQLATPLTPVNPATSSSSTAAPPPAISTTADATNRRERIVPAWADDAYVFPPNQGQGQQNQGEVGMQMKIQHPLLMSSGVGGPAKGGMIMDSGRRANEDEEALVGARTVYGLPRRLLSRFLATRWESTLEVVPSFESSIHDHQNSSSLPGVVVGAGNAVANVAAFAGAIATSVLTGEMSPNLIGDDERTGVLPNGVSHHHSPTHSVCLKLHHTVFLPLAPSLLFPIQIHLSPNRQHRHHQQQLLNQKWWPTVLFVMFFWPLVPALLTFRFFLFCLQYYQSRVHDPRVARTPGSSGQWLRYTFSEDVMVRLRMREDDVNNWDEGMSGMVDYEKREREREEWELPETVWEVDHVRVGWGKVGDELGHHLSHLSSYFLKSIRSVATDEDVTRVLGLSDFIRTKSRRSQQRSVHYRGESEPLPSLASLLFKLALTLVAVWLVGVLKVLELFLGSTTPSNSRGQLDDIIGDPLRTMNGGRRDSGFHSPTHDGSISRRGSAAMLVSEAEAWLKTWVSDVEQDAARWAGGARRASGPGGSVGGGGMTITGGKGEGDRAKRGTRSPSMRGSVSVQVEVDVDVEQEGQDGNERNKKADADDAIGDGNALTNDGFSVAYTGPSTPPRSSKHALTTVSSTSPFSACLDSSPIVTPAPQPQVPFDQQDRKEDGVETEDAVDTSYSRRRSSPSNLRVSFVSPPAVSPRDSSPHPVGGMDSGNETDDVGFGGYVDGMRSKNRRDGRRVVRVFASEADTDSSSTSIHNRDDSFTSSGGFSSTPPTALSPTLPSDPTKRSDQDGNDDSQLKSPPSPPSTSGTMLGDFSTGDPKGPWELRKLAVINGASAPSPGSSPWLGGENEEGPAESSPMQEPEVAPEFAKEAVAIPVSEPCPSKTLTEEAGPELHLEPESQELSPLVPEPTAPSLANVTQDSSALSLENSDLELPKVEEALAKDPEQEVPTEEQDDFPAREEVEQQASVFEEASNVEDSSLMEGAKSKEEEPQSLEDAPGQNADEEQSTKVEQPSKDEETKPSEAIVEPPKEVEVPTIEQRPTQDFPQAAKEPERPSTMGPGREPESLLPTSREEPEHTMASAQEPELLLATPREEPDHARPSTTPIPLTKVSEPVSAAPLLPKARLAEPKISTSEPSFTLTQEPLSVSKVSLPDPSASTSASGSKSDISEVKPDPVVGHSNHQVLPALTPTPPAAEGLPHKSKQAETVPKPDQMVSSQAIKGDDESGHPVKRPSPPTIPLPPISTPPQPTKQDSTPTTPTSQPTPSKLKKKNKSEQVSLPPIDPSTLAPMQPYILPRPQPQPHKQQHISAPKGQSPTHSKPPFVVPQPNPRMSEPVILPKASMPPPQPREQGSMLASLQRASSRNKSVSSTSTTTTSSKVPPAAAPPTKSTQHKSVPTPPAPSRQDMSSHPKVASSSKGKGKERDIAFPPAVSAAVAASSIPRPDSPSASSTASGNEKISTSGPKSDPSKNKKRKKKKSGTTF